MCDKSSDSTEELDVAKLFNVLESNNSAEVQEVKQLINESFNTVKDNWLVVGLYDYYLQTGSSRCADILWGVKEPHDKFLIERLIEGLRSMSKDSKRRTLTFLGLVISKQPSWLYKIVQHGLLKEMIKALKIETDVVVLLTGLLSIIMLIPSIPAYITTTNRPNSSQYLNDIFDVFGRIAMWTHSANVPKAHLLHLQVGLYSLFHRLYAMYPCNFLSYLRHCFSAAEKRTVFGHTILPMLEKVKMHPSLVTATKEGELNSHRWRGKEYHEIVAECSKISLDVYESSFSEDVVPTFNRLEFAETNTGKNTKDETQSQADDCRNAEYLSSLPQSSLISQAINAEMVSLSTHIDENASTAPPTPLSVTSVSSAHPLSKATVSPPETALEATPENTPILQKDRDKIFNKLPASSAAVQLNFGGKDLTRDKSSKQHSTPGNSLPSSPAPFTGSGSSSATNDFGGGAGTSLPRRDSIFDSALRYDATIPKDSTIYQHVQKMRVEQNQLQLTSSCNVSDTLSSSNSNYPTTSGSTLSQRKSSIPAPININSMSIAEESHFPDFCDKDKSTGGPLTPMLSNSGPGQGLIDPDLSRINLDDESLAEDCKSSTCSKGGLHMANHQQMMAFAQQVKRLRFHSQCGMPDQQSTSPSPGASPSSSSFLQEYRARNIKRSMSCPNIKKPIEETSLRINDTVSEIKEETTETEYTQLEELTHDHIFQKILPAVLSPPLEKRSIDSPYYLLDLCIIKAANSRAVKSKNDEISILKSQVELLHSQLLFERHRREAHALRNRRLASKCQKLLHLEDQKASRASEIQQLENELFSLRKEMKHQHNVDLLKEKEMQTIINDLDRKLTECRKQITDLQEDKAQVEFKYRQLHEDFVGLQKDSDKKMADIFAMENEIKHLNKYVEINNELRSAFELSQREILILGELLRKYQEAPTESYSRCWREENDDFRRTYDEEIRNLRNALDNKSSRYEAIVGLTQDLEKKLEKRENIILEQGQTIKAISDENEAQIRVWQAKYEQIKDENQRMEFEILNLQHQLAMNASRPSRGRITSSPSNGDLSPTGNSNHSDVDSAASAAGYQLSPDRNICFFGSPPLDEMKELQISEEHGSEANSTSCTRRNSSVN